MNSRFLNRQGWQTEVNKMITSYGAPIVPADAKIIVDYLAANYGSVTDQILRPDKPLKGIQCLLQ